MLKSRTISGLVLLLGIALLGFSLYITQANYHPLPPGHTPIDGRGLFAPLIIVPLASLGGILVAKSLMALKQLQTRALVRLFLYSISATVAVSLPVAYMLFFTGPDIGSDPSIYYDWYLFSPILSPLTVFAEGIRSWWVFRIRD